MLLGLSIRDVVLIDRLDIAFAPGLTVLTGETGAGKSILLDSLGLALGARAELGMLRPGATQLSVTAEFAPHAAHPVHAMLAEQGLAAAETVILRRVVGADGRSRAFVNDQPASVGLLRRLGESLAEIHGQFESHTLLDPATHRDVLDAFAGLDAKTAAEAWTAWRAAEAARAAAEAEHAAARGEEEYLRHALGELDALAIKPGEETELAARRVTLMAGEKLAEAMEAARQSLARPADIEAGLRAARRALDRVAEKAGGRLDAVIAGLIAPRWKPPRRATCSRPWPPRSTSTRATLSASRNGCSRCAPWRASTMPRWRNCCPFVNAWRRGWPPSMPAAKPWRGWPPRRPRPSTLYLAAAQKLSKARHAAAAKLDKAVAAELPPLKLERANFATRVESLAEFRLGSVGQRPHHLRGGDQSRRRAGSAGQGGLGRRTGAVHAGAETGPRPHQPGGDHRVRRGRCRCRRRHRGGGR